MLIPRGPVPGVLPEAATGLAGMVQPGQAALDPAILSGEAIPTDDGGMEIRLAEPEQEPLTPQDIPHDGNLALALPDDVLNTIAGDLIEAIEADVESNEEYYETLSRGTKLLGLKPGERMSQPFSGASAATHPLLKEAVVRFCANAGAELIPADGPARCRIFGDTTPDQEAKAQRKAGFLNYYLTEEDEEYADDFDQMLLVEGLYGSVFRKVWRDPLRDGAATSRHFTPYDIVVSAHATTMHGSYRVTHIEPMPPSDVRRLQLTGWFADIDLSEPADDDTPARAEREKWESRRPTDLPGDTDHVLWHCHCLLDIPGMEHVAEGDEPSGMHLPYIVTIERESQKVLRVARNWLPGDKSYRPREYYCHYKYMPGLGFYGWGLIHLVGADTDTLSVLRRQVINTITLNSFPGGLRTKTTTAENTDLTVAPGEFRAIETGGMPISSAVMPMPYKDVSPAAPEVMDQIEQGGQRLASVGDMAVGDSRDDALPGTVLALIKQATKLESSVIRRNFRALRRELRLLANLFGSMDQERYPYAINGVSGIALKSDFANNADVVPVADPNIPTQTERLAIAQADITLAQSTGGLVSMREAIKRFWQVSGKTDADIQLLMPPPQSGVPADPVTEFKMAMQGAPLKAAPEQDHVSHVQAHIGQMASPGIQNTPIASAIGAHIGEHTAMFYAAELQRITGIQIPNGPVPPQIQDQIAKAAAAASNQLHQTMLQLAPPAQGGDPTLAAKIALDRAKLQFDAQDAQRKSAEQVRQDSIDWARMQQQSRDNAAQRKNDLAEALIARDTARIKAGSQAASDMIGHATEMVGQHGAIRVAAEKTKQAEHSARGREARAASKGPASG